MKCKVCQRPMSQLFTSWACDYCDGKTAASDDRHREDLSPSIMARVMRALMYREKLRQAQGVRYVRYEVEGFGQQEAGPYASEMEAEAQRDDIEGYEGVSGAYVKFRPKSD